MSPDSGFTEDSVLEKGSVENPIDLTLEGEEEELLGLRGFVEGMANSLLFYIN